MKKILMSFITVFIMIFALSACNNKNKGDEQKPTPAVEVITLEAPKLTVNDTIVTWDANPNAEGYIVNVDGKDKDKQTKNTFELAVSENGEYSIKVKSIAKDKENYKDSEYSKEVIIGIYDDYLAELNLTDNEDLKTVSWKAISKADKYLVYVDDVLKDTITELSYDYSSIEKVGKHIIKVVAKSNSKDHGPSSKEIEINVGLEQLESPKVSLNTTTVLWDEVENASSYVIYDNDVEVAKQQTLSYLIEDTSINHKIKIKALSNKENYKDSEFSKEIITKLSKTGYLDDTTGDFTQYLNTSAYVQVTNASELLTALKNAKYDYTSTVVEVLENKGYVVRSSVDNKKNWDIAVTKGLFVKNEDGTYTKIPEGTEFDTVYPKEGTYYEDSPYSPVSFTQTLNKEGTVHVIEIMNDIELGWNVLSSEAKAIGNVKSFETTNESLFTMSDMYTTYGMSQITITRCYDLLIYSKNGAKLTHGGFKLESSKNVAIRNLVFDELWQWEDTSSTSTGAVGDMDAFGWAYFKINNSDEIWIDHCSFGKSYDGTIDVSDPTFDTIGTLFRAPYGSDGTSDVHISWCKFNDNAADKNGYVYKMMQKVEANYKSGNYLYYKALRDAGYTFDDIFYGIAVPHKKAFLICDNNENDPTKYEAIKNDNKNLNISIAFCEFYDIEDRIPKVRSANAYLYGNIVDNSRYYSYLKLLKSKTVNGTTIKAKDIVSAVNSNWKCAGVSHGVLVSQDGSAYVYGCIFKGITELLSNNDSGKGGIIIDNTRYVNEGEFDYTGSTSLENNEFLKHTGGTISPQYFSWNNETNSIPFYVEAIDLNNLEGLLPFCGTVDSTNGTLVENYYLKSAAHI